MARAKNIRSLSLISSDHEASKVFVAEATTMGVTVPRILELSPGARHRDLTAQTATFVEHSDSLKPAIAMLVTSDEATLIAEELIRMNGLHRVRPRWLLGVLGIDMSSLGGGAWRAAFNGAYLAEPDMPELVEFGEHFLLSLEVRTKKIQIFIVYIIKATIERNFGGCLKSENDYMMMTTFPLNRFICTAYSHKPA